jgi:hypothetical protein
MLLKPWYLYTCDSGSVMKYYLLSKQEWRIQRQHTSRQMEHEEEAYRKPSRLRSLRLTCRPRQPLASLARSNMIQVLTDAVYLHYNYQKDIYIRYTIAKYSNSRMNLITFQSIRVNVE